MFTRRGALCALTAAALSAAAAPGVAQAQTGADLNVSPKRIVVAPNERAATVYVFNRGDTPATYNITMVDRTMTPDGEIVAVDQASEKAGGPEAAARVKTAAPYITFTPRRVTLGPGQSQVVRLRVLRPADLAAGEYRSHLTVVTVPSEASGLTAEAAASDEPNQLVARINVLFSISIPVIVRQGPPEVAIALENLRYAQRSAEEAGGKPAGVLTLDLVRKGVNSVYGDVEIRRAGAAKSSPPIGQVRGVAVYPEVERRPVSVTLTTPPAPGERLEVIWRDDDTKSGQILATATLTTP